MGSGSSKVAPDVEGLCKEGEGATCEPLSPQQQLRTAEQRIKATLKELRDIMNSEVRKLEQQKRSLERERLPPARMNVHARRIDGQIRQLKEAYQAKQKEATDKMAEARLRAAQLDATEKAAEKAAKNAQQNERAAVRQGEANKRKVIRLELTDKLNKMVERIAWRVAAKKTVDEVLDLIREKPKEFTKAKIHDLYHTLFRQNLSLETIQLTAVRNKALQTIFLSPDSDYLEDIPDKYRPYAPEEFNEDLPELSMYTTKTYSSEKYKDLLVDEWREDPVWGSIRNFDGGSRKNRKKKLTRRRR